jgi:hypothetical protein
VEKEQRRERRLGKEAGKMLAATIYNPTNRKIVKINSCTVWRS